MLRLVLQSAILLRGMLTRWRPLLTLPMGSASYLDPPTALFQSGMMRPVLQLASLSGSIPTWSSPLYAPLTESTSFLGRITTPLIYLFHILLSDLPLVTQRTLAFVQSPTRMVGSKTPR